MKPVLVLDKSSKSLTLFKNILDLKIEFSLNEYIKIDSYPSIVNIINFYIFGKLLMS